MSDNVPSGGVRVDVDFASRRQNPAGCGVPSLVISTDAPGRARAHHHNPCRCKTPQGPGNEDGGECRSCGIGRSPCTCDGCAHSASRKPRLECAWCIQDLGLEPTPGASHGICRRHYREVSGEDPPPGTGQGPRDLAGARSRPRSRRKNPAQLILVTGNPRMSAAEARGKAEDAWAHFHQQSGFGGKVEMLPAVVGVPSTLWALGTLVGIDLGQGEARFSSPPWLAGDPTTGTLYVLDRQAMDLRSGSGKSVRSVVYRPVRGSGKEQGADFKHDFKRPYPSLSPIGAPGRARAAVLDGGVYSVTDWIYD